MNALVEKAFLVVSQGYSEDRVVADPDLNRKFIEECRANSLVEAPAELNQALLNLRKRGLRRRSTRSKSTRIGNNEDYRFAAEIAARHLEQRYRTTLDRILCDPDLATELDAIAAELAPGRTSLEYRWAALQLRKNNRLKPELVLRVSRIAMADFGPIEKVRLDRLPDAHGIYIFYSPKETLYVGEAENLRKRVAKHLNHSDSKSLAHWFWQNGFTDVRLETLELTDEFESIARKAVEKQLIASRNPVFNIKR